ncbi:hypothetical protein N7532_011026 [Penicillium argentinense]|uniref:Uncharacterized protein n=1 Tax=Penicillium argentinense TaxID=1131581 RepID=A0A9W9EHM1_9EURO|nr:uncharacterized protein N7532_011026 [Penicillium argentinense]KAJ5081983.1 hypothetical protein N7532_011026 [Penicillium argentinense]
MPTNPADFLRDAHVFSNIGRPRGVSQQPEHRPMPPSSEAPVSPQKPGGKKSTPSQPKKPASGGTRKASQQTEQKALPHSSKAPVNPRKPEEKQVPSNQSKPESKRKQQAQLDKKKLQPAKEQPKSPSAHQSIQSVSQPPGASEGGKGPPPQRPPKAQASSSERKAPKVASVTKAAPTPKAPTGILLDLGDFEPNTPPTIGSIDAIASSLMSPSAQQLEGLEFLEGVKTKKQYIDELIDQYDGQLIDEQTGQPLSKAQFAAALRHAFGNVNVREPTSQEPVHAHAQILQPETPVKEQSHRGKKPKRVSFQDEDEVINFTRKGGPHTPVSSPRALSNGSFSEYRSPANISSSGDEAAGYAVDDNLSPKKSSPEHLAPQLELLSISDPLPGLGSKRHRSGSSSDIGPSKSGKLPSRLSDIGSREREGLTKRILSEEILSKIPSKLRSHEGKRHQIGFESSSTGKTAKLVLECRKDKKKKVWSQRLGVDKTRAAGTPEPIRVRSTTPGRADEAVSLLDEMKPLDTMMGQYKAKHKEIISSISGDDASSVSTTGKLDVAVHTPPRSKLDPCAFFFSPHSVNSCLTEEVSASGSPSMRLARVRNVFAVGETLEKYREAHKNLVSSGTSETVPEGHRASTAAHSSLDMNLEPVLSRRSGNEVTGGQLERFEDFMKRHISASTISEKQPSPAPPTPLTLGVQSIDRGNFDMAPMNDPMEIDFITKPNSRAQSRAITPGLQTSIYATDSGRESAKPSVTPTKRTSMGTMGTNPITEVLHTPAFEVPVSVDPAFVERLVETQAKIMEKLTNTAEIKGPNVFDTQLGMGPSMGKKAKPTAPETGTDTPKWPTVLGVPSGMRPTMEKLMKAADPDTNAEKPKGPFAVSFQSGPRRPPMDTKITPAGTGAEQPKILTVLGVQSGMCHSSMDTKVKSTDADDDKPKRPMVLGPRPYLPNRGL